MTEIAPLKKVNSFHTKCSTVWLGFGLGVGPHPHQNSRSRRRHDIRKHLEHVSLSAGHFTWIKRKRVSASYPLLYYETQILADYHLIFINLVGRY